MFVLQPFYLDHVLQASEVRVPRKNGGSKLLSESSHVAGCQRDGMAGFQVGGVKGKGQVGGRHMKSIYYCLASAYFPDSAKG